MRFIVPPHILRDADFHIDEVLIGSDGGPIHIHQKLYATTGALEVSIHDSLFLKVSGDGKLHIAKVINNVIHKLQVQLVNGEFTFRFSDQKPFKTLGLAEVVIPTGLGSGLDSDGGAP